MCPYTSYGYRLLRVTSALHVQHLHAGCDTCTRAFCMHFHMAQATYVSLVFTALVACLFVEFHAFRPRGTRLHIHAVGRRRSLRAKNPLPVIVTTKNLTNYTRRRCLIWRLISLLPPMPTTSSGRTKWCRSVPCLMLRLI